MSFASKRRFDLVEVTLVAFLAVLATGLLARLVPRDDTTAEAQALARRYGPAHFSQHEEEWAIRDYFQDKRNGFFVDVGANDYKLFSNTYYLESKLGWSGLAIEPQREYEKGYLANRPRTRFLSFFVDATSNAEAKLFISSTTHLVSSAERDFTARWGGTLKETTVPTITLDDLLDHERVRGIDLLSVDVELHEPQALAGLDIERFRPSLVCIEAHPEVRQAILDYFARHRYVIVGRYLRSDTDNLYFAPLNVR
jgi:FkbM family methyltransferase